MKIGPRLATALVKLVLEEKVDCNEASQAALAILKTSSPSEISTFPRLVAREIRRSPVLPIRVTTVTGSSGLDAPALLNIFPSRAIDLHSEASPTLLGGVIVQVRDERLDMSLRTGLESLQSLLLKPLVDAAQ